MRRQYESVLALALTCLALPGAAFGYIDLGTGSYLFQILIGFGVASLFMLKSFWRSLIDRVVNLFRRKRRDDPKEDKPDEEH